MDLSSGMLIFIILCAFLFEKTWCFVHSAESLAWPSGSYALPMADTGCPEGNGFTWFTGRRTEELENEQNKNKYSPNFHLMSKINTPDITRYFCVKNATETDEGRFKWPDGKYCIYKKGYSCPQGFHEGYVLWDDNNGKNSTNRNSKRGELPEGLYDKDTLIYFCCKKTGSAMKRISLPVNKPFYLLAFESATCQEVQGAVYSLEYIVFDTENTSNHDTTVYPYPYAAHLREPTIYYCHYKECKWNFTQPNGEFSSPYYPDNYHDYQDCQWNITAPRGHVIRLQFGVFELESNPHSCGDGRCSCDYVEVKEESVIGDVTVLGRYCMTITPPAIIESSTNKMVVRFYSDPAISAKGFNASYTTIALIKDRITTTATTISSTVESMRSSSRGSTTGSTKRTTTTQHPTSGTVRNNLTTTSGLFNSAGSVNETERTITLGTKRHSFIITESSKEIQGIVQRSLINARSTQGEKGPERPTTVKPTNSRSKVTSTEVIHRHVGQSSGVLKPTTRGIMGLPLEYFLIISGSFAVVVLGVLCLMCKICKRRNRSSMKRAQQSDPFHLVTYSSVRDSSGSTVPSSPINMYGNSDLEKQCIEDQLIDNPIYHKRNKKNNCKSLDTKKLKESVKPLCEASGLADHGRQLKLSDNPLYESAFLIEAIKPSNQKESRTENPLYEYSQYKETKNA